jgi:hypothetical protein
MTLIANANDFHLESHHHHFNAAHTRISNTCFCGEAPCRSRQSQSQLRQASRASGYRKTAGGATAKRAERQ